MRIVRYTLGTLVALCLAGSTSWAQIPTTTEGLKKTATTAGKGAIEGGTQVIGEVAKDPGAAKSNPGGTAKKVATGAGKGAVGAVTGKPATPAAATTPSTPAAATPATPATPVAPVRSRGKVIKKTAGATGTSDAVAK